MRKSIVVGGDEVGEWIREMEKEREGVCGGKIKS